MLQLSGIGLYPSLASDPSDCVASKASDCTSLSLSILCSHLRLFFTHKRRGVRSQSG